MRNDDNCTRVDDDIEICPYLEPGSLFAPLMEVGHLPSNEIWSFPKLICLCFNRVV